MRKYRFFEKYIFFSIDEQDYLLRYTQKPFCRMKDVTLLKKRSTDGDIVQMFQNTEILIKETSPSLWGQLKGIAELLKFQLCS